TVVNQKLGCRNPHRIFGSLRHYRGHRETPSSFVVLILQSLQHTARVAAPAVHEWVGPPGPPAFVGRPPGRETLRSVRPLESMNFRQRERRAALGIPLDEIRSRMAKCGNLPYRSVRGFFLSEEGQLSKCESGG